MNRNFTGNGMMTNRYLEISIFSYLPCISTRRTGLDSWGMYLTYFFRLLFRLYLKFVDIFCLFSFFLYGDPDHQAELCRRHNKVIVFLESYRYTGASFGSKYQQIHFNLKKQLNQNILSASGGMYLSPHRYTPQKMTLTIVKEMNWCVLLLMWRFCDPCGP